MIDHAVRRLIVLLTLAALAGGAAQPGAASAAPLAELVAYPTDDRVRLHALLWQPAGATKAVVIHVPGMTGGFVGPLDLNPVAAALTARGYAFMAVNMRTAGLHGMLLARFEDYEKDVEAAVRYARSRGFTDVALVGHSLGGPRIVYYWTRTREPSVRALVFSASIKSPYLEAQLRWNERERAEYDAFLQGGARAGGAGAWSTSTRRRWPTGCRRWCRRPPEGGRRPRLSSARLILVVCYLRVR
jgi:alpha-beta hydrolase superfamily lysophospholipase